MLLPAPALTLAMVKSVLTKTFVPVTIICLFHCRLCRNSQDTWSPRQADVYNVPSFPFSVCSSYMQMSCSDWLAIVHEIQSCLSGRGDGVPLVSPYSSHSPPPPPPAGVIWSGPHTYKLPRVEPLATTLNTLATVLCTWHKMPLTTFTKHLLCMSPGPNYVGITSQKENINNPILETTF